MKKIHNKFRFWLASSLLVGTTLLTGVGFVYASNNSGNTPPGNNGTVKIDGADIGSGHDNDPHVGCVFNVAWWNYDQAAGQLTSTVTFELQSPTAPPDNTMTVNSADLSPQFTGNGGTTTADHVEAYTLTFTGAPQVNQGYHVKLTVDTPYSNGSDKKSKVFWVEGCDQTITATAPSATTPSCDVQTETVTAPTITGVTWNHGTPQTLSPGQSVTFMASADTGYTFANGAQTSWPFTNSFNTADCGQTQGDTTEPTIVSPTEPLASEPSCQVQSETITPPTITGVVWSPNGATVLNAANPTVTYTATPDTGYAFPEKVQSSWQFTYAFDNSDCGQGQVLGDEVTVVTPGDPDPEFTDATCSAAGSYTVIAKEGVIYKDDQGNVIDPGTYTVATGTTVTITAYPANNSVEFSRDTQTVWTHTFAAPSCGQVLGASTTAGGSTPQVLGATTLTDSGTSPVPTTVLAAMLIVSSFFVHGKRKKSTATRPKRIEVQFL